MERGLSAKDIRAKLLGKNRQLLECYWGALGRFVDKFAEVECLVVSTLAKLLNFNDGQLKAILAGTRADAARQHIGRLFDVGAADVSTEDRLRRALDQFHEITRLRNDILHYGAQVKPGDLGAYLEVTNAGRIIDLKEVRTTRVSDRLMDVAHNDLTKIQMCLLWSCHRDTMTPEVRRAVEAEIDGPWLYKSQSQSRKSNRKGPKGRKAARTRGHQPQSSQG